ncbi:MAG: hypothetical protein AAB497_03085 [Patescibacteria group bacterium]
MFFLNKNMDRRKRNILIIAIAILVLIILGGAYWYFSRKPAPVGPPPEFPGGAGPYTRPGGEIEPEEPEFVPGSGAPLPRLYELHKVPVAGVGFFESGQKADRTVSSRYIERGLGHIFETPLATYVESRISNETHAGLSEALWGNGGKSVVIRSLSDKYGSIAIKSSILNLGSTISSFARSTSTESIPEFTETEEVLLPDFIPFMATAEDGADKLFYLENGASASAGSVASFKNVASASKIFSSVFTEWLPQFPNQNLVTLASKPSAGIPGHLFFINTKTKALTKPLGGIMGLTTLTSHDGKFILYSEAIAELSTLWVYDTATRAARSLPVRTLPEKCTWSFKNPTLAYCAVPQTLPVARYPDQWYQGTVSFSDTVWTIDTATGRAEKVMTPSDYNAPSLDIINPVLSSDDYYLLFMNKVTGTPWVYRTVEVIPPWVEPVAPKVAPKATTKKR